MIFDGIKHLCKKRHNPIKFREKEIEEKRTDTEKILLSPTECQTDSSPSFFNQFSGCP